VVAVCLKKDPKVVLPAPPARDSVRRVVP